MKLTCCSWIAAICAAKTPSWLNSLRKIRKRDGSTSPSTAKLTRSPPALGRRDRRLSCRSVRQREAARVSCSDGERGSRDGPMPIGCLRRRALSSGGALIFYLISTLEEGPPVG